MNTQSTYYDLKKKYPELDIVISSNMRHIRYFTCENITIDDVRALFSHEGITFSIIPPYNYSARYITSQTIRCTPLLSYSLVSNEQVFSDIILIIDSHKFYVHRIVLAAASTYFKNLFTRMKESTQSIIELKEINHHHFRKYLDILYGTGVLMEEPDLLHILNLSVRLLTLCINYEDILLKLPIPEGDNMGLLVELIEQVYGKDIPESIMELMDDFHVEL